MTDLLIRGGTVVTVGGSRRADVAVDGGRIVAVEPELGEQHASGAREIVDATGLLVLPGCVDVHTHVRVPTDAEPDRFFQDSVAAAFGGTTSFLVFNTPSTGGTTGGTTPVTSSLVQNLDNWRRLTENDSAVDYGVSLVVMGQIGDPVAEIPAIVDAGVPTAKAFMVYDFRLPDRTLFETMRALGQRGGMLEVHCEDPVIIDTGVEAALARGETAPRYHASSRSREAEAVATHRAMEFARASGAPAHAVHLSNAAALEEIRRARATGVAAHAETCPHYLTLPEDRYLDPDPARVIGAVISPPLRPASDRDAMWAGLADGTLDLVATDHVPDRLDREKLLPAPPFDQISNGAPGIETLLALVYGGGVAKGRLTLERMVDVLATTPARLFGLGSKGSIETGKDADIVLFDPAASRTIRAADLHHTSDYTAYEGIDVEGAARSVFVRGRPVIRNGAFVGERGFGRFIERRLVDGIA
ncbi:MAG TPA: dihydropyrimidinase [Candidatus Limnocylindrales bacterium]|nr:dihydropyrimidinase [Candidatus Limnocylindrales bacterium]